MADSFGRKTLRHLQMAARAHGITPLATPPYLVLHVTSSCNLRCEHCSEHAKLNRTDDLRLADFVKLSEELGQLESLHITGGEPLLHEELEGICSQFIRQNRLQRLSISTSGYYVARTSRTIDRLLTNNPALKQCSIELSLDGTTDFHNRFRGDVRAFDNTIQTYYGLAALARRDARVRLSVVSVVTRDNVDEIERLSRYLYDRCPQLERHQLRLLSGERRRPTLRAPEVGRFLSLEQRIRRIWADRVRSPRERVTEPLMSWARAQALSSREQVVPCKAGVLSAVINANGDVNVCETDSTHPHLGNLREHSFRELWSSPQAEKARNMIRTKQCACANERCLVPSVLYQPGELAKARLKHAWRDQPRALPAEAPLAYATIPPVGVQIAPR
jgi:radical SAM protein with 4Fe4S-binding SPASM domain